MRSTQYIGLTNAAREYVRTAISKERIVITHGICDEDVFGFKYTMPTPKGPNKALYAIERVQEMPWSSGPMIFTNLKMELVKDSGQVLAREAYSWAYAPGLEKDVEYDPKLGLYLV